MIVIQTKAVGFLTHSFPFSVPKGAGRFLMRRVYLLNFNILGFSKKKDWARYKLLYSHNFKLFTLKSDFIKLVT
jgi:hypothetical protein